MKGEIFRTILTVSFLLFFLLPNFVFAEVYPDGTLLRGRNDVRVYIIHNQGKRWIKNITIFNSYNLNWKDIRVVSLKAIDALLLKKLIRVKDDEKVYLLNDAGFRRHIQNPDIFNSYGFDWNDIATVSVEELSSYPESYLIKSVSSPEIYFLEGGTKRWVTDIEAFYKNDFEWEAVSLVNERDLEFYQAGDPITPEVKVIREITPAIPTNPYILSPPVVPPTATSTAPSLPSNIVPAQPAVPPTATSTPPSLPGGGGESGNSAIPAQPATPAIPASPSSTPPASSIDTTPPTVSFIAPLNGATVSGIINVSVNVSDNIGVAGVYFFRDGLDLWGEVTKSPYTVSWDTRIGRNRSFTLSARARDNAGNIAYAPEITVIVCNESTGSSCSALLTISNVSSSQITSSGATIAWTTNKPSDSRALVGLNSPTNEVTANYDPLVISHSLTISGLQPNTLYYYKVSSMLEVRNRLSGSDLFSDIYTFTTLPLPDTTAPLIASVSVTNIGTNGANIQWATNEESYNTVEYGLTTSYGATKIDSNRSFLPILRLSELSPGTLYHFKVKSQDLTGNAGVSSDYTFTTIDPSDTTAPIITSVVSDYIGSGRATIMWSTNEPSDSYVEHGTTTGYGLITNNDRDINITAHTVDLKYLNQATTYHYRVKSKDNSGNLAISDDYTFTTTSIFTSASIKPSRFLADFLHTVRNLFKKIF